MQRQMQFEDFVIVAIDLPGRPPTKMPIETMGPHAWILRASQEQALVTRVGERSHDTVEQRAPDAVAFSLWQQRKHDYLAGTGIAEAVAFDFFASSRNVTDQPVASDVARPRLDGDTQRSKSLCGDCILTGQAADADELGRVGRACRFNDVPQLSHYGVSSSVMKTLYGSSV
jgi:hypothetical protein